MRPTTNPERITPIGNLIARVCERVGPFAEAAGVAIVVDCGGGQLIGDSLDAEEILEALLLDAVATTLPGRAVYLDTESLGDQEQSWTVQCAGPRLICDPQARRRLRSACSLAALRRIRGVLAMSMNPEGPAVRLVFSANTNDSVLPPRAIPVVEQADDSRVRSVA